jgi:hypothetical protein
MPLDTTFYVPYKRMRAGVLFKLTSFWVGIHYSKYERRFCINLVPCVTVWITLPGGNVPCV